MVLLKYFNWTENHLHFCFILPLMPPIFCLASDIFHVLHLDHCYLLWHFKHMSVLLMPGFTPKIPWKSYFMSQKAVSRDVDGFYQLILRCEMSASALMKWRWMEFPLWCRKYRKKWHFQNSSEMCLSRSMSLCMTQRCIVGFCMLWLCTFALFVWTCHHLTVSDICPFSCTVSLFSVG